MTLEDRASDGDGQGPDPDHSRRSFHGRLLTRSARSRPDHRKRRALAWLADRAGWVYPFGRWVGQGAIFGAGLAIGGALMLLRRGEPLRDSPGAMLVVGLGLALVAIFANLLAREASKAWTPAPRG